MLIDTNTYLGHWAFRPLPWHNADDLLRAMDRYDIAQAWVSSASAILYRNPQAGNQGHAAQVRPQPARWGPWEHDLAVCHEEFGARGLRLYPRYHRYALNDANGRALIRAATERKMVLSVPLRVEDYRQRSWLIDAPDVPAAEVAEAALANPDARFLPVQGVGYLGTALGRSGEVQADYALEVSRLAAFVSDDLQRLIAAVGAGRLVFGSGMPFTVPDVPLLKLEMLDLPAEEMEGIRWRNAARLLG